MNYPCKTEEVHHFCPKLAHHFHKIREGVKKNRIYLGLCPKLWVGGSKGGSKVPNFLVKITIQLFLLQTSRNVLKHVIHKWGGHIWPFHDALRPQRWNFVRKISHFFKKIKCSKQPKKQNKLNFYFSLSGVPNVRGGWVGSDVWDKVPNKYGFFLTPSLSYLSEYSLLWQLFTDSGSGFLNCIGGSAAPALLFQTISQASRSM